MRDRNLSFPAVSLPVALEKVTLLHDAYGKAKIDFAQAFACWDYAPRGRVDQNLIDALECFGLVNAIEIEGKQRLKISEMALRDLFSESTSELHRSNAIKAFALAPDIYRVLWERWGDILPSDDQLAEFLAREVGFHRGVHRQFIRDYLASVVLAQKHGLIDKTIEFGKEDTDLDSNSDDLEIEIQTPHESLGLEDDTVTKMESETVNLPKNRGWQNPELQVYDEDISIEVIEITENGELTVIDANQHQRPSTPESRLNLRKTREVARYPVSSDCNFYLMADGPVNRGAFEALIAQISLQLEIGEFDAADDS